MVAQVSETPQQSQKDKPIKEEKGEKADISQIQLDELQHDLELQMEASEKRLGEIQSLSNQNQDLANKVVELENNVNILNIRLFMVPFLDQIPAHLYHQHFTRLYLSSIEVYSFG